MTDRSFAIDLRYGSPGRPIDEWIRSDAQSRESRVGGYAWATFVERVVTDR